MTSAVRGLVKIGKTETQNFETRMKQLENNGYFNVAGLKRLFAIEVEDYSEKEKMLHEIFEKARLDSSELFAINKDLAMELLSAFDGRVVYPLTKNKEQIFDDAAAAVEKEVEARAVKKQRGRRRGVITDNEGRRIEGHPLSGPNGILARYLLEVAQDPVHADALRELSKKLPNSKLSECDVHPGKNRFLKLTDRVFLHTNLSAESVAIHLTEITSKIGIQAKLEDLGHASDSP